MNFGLAAITAVVVGGAVVAVTSRDSRATLLGLLVVLLGAPLLADPLPTPLPIAARMVAAVLACRLVAVAIRGDDVATSGSRLGWPVEVLAALAAAIVGYGTHGLGAVPEGPVTAQVAGFAVGALAVGPIVSGRDVLRLGIGAMLLLVGASLVRVGLAGTPSELEQLVLSALVVGLGGTIAVIVAGSRAATGRLEIAGEAARAMALDGPPERDVRPGGRSSIHIGRARGLGPDAHPNTGLPRPDGEPDTGGEPGTGGREPGTGGR